jgi:hypothetical protein
MDVEVYVDEHAFFAELRSQGIDYEGDEAWHLDRERARLRRKREAEEEEARNAREDEEARWAKELRDVALDAALDSGDQAVLDRVLAEMIVPDLASPSGTCPNELTEVVTEAATLTCAAADPSHYLPSTGPMSSSTDWIDEVLSAPVPAKPRLPVGVSASRNRIYKNWLLFRKFSKQVTLLAWEEKFPFLHKVITTEDSSSFKDLPEEQEEVHPRTTGRFEELPGPVMCKLPAWNKLPSASDRSPELTEIITGARFASVSLDGELDAGRWLLDLPGSEVCCLSIDLHGDAAKRFLRGENGNVGAALHRSLRRRLERDLGDLAIAAIWVRPTSESEDDVRVFLLLRSGDTTNARCMGDWDQGKRHFASLIRHGVKLSDSDKPLSIPDEEERAGYYGLTVAEMHARFPTWSENPIYTDVEEREYTPESGFASQEEIEARAAASHVKWNRYASRHALPSWFCHRFVERLQDCLVHAPEHVRSRQKLKAKIIKGHYFGGRTSKTDRIELARLENMQLPPWYIRFYRGSPAQLAAVAVRSGTVLGEYFDSRHKAGRAKELYEQIRKTKPYA